MRVVENELEGIGYVLIWWREDKKENILKGVAVYLKLVMRPSNYHVSKCNRHLLFKKETKKEGKPQICKSRKKS